MSNICKKKELFQLQFASFFRFIAAYLSLTHRVTAARPLWCVYLMACFSFASAKTLSMVSLRCAWNVYQEQIRQQYNNWIREQADFDYVVDPEPLLLEKGTHDTYAGGLNQGDFLHPNASGGQIIADTFSFEKLFGTKFR